MKNILKLYTSNNKVNGNELLFYLSRSSRIFINTLNEYFKKKVNLDEYNINQNDLVKIESKNKNLNNKIPYLKNKKDKKKVFTLVLDLDETIISYQKGTFIPRPGLNKFLTEINKLYEIIVFTSATQNYADSILDSIDKNNIYFEKRLYRQHTVFINDTFVKDLSKLGRDLSKVIILDNRPQNYSLQKDNGIFIRSFYGDNKYDNALINLIPILKNIAKSPYNDVRKELKKLSEEIFTKVTTDLYDGNYI
jgi:CTD small phosphatase-like protein 2